MVPDYRKSVRESLNEVDDRLANLHQKVLKSRRCSAGRCYICKARRCAWMLLRHGRAREPARKEFYEERILRDPVRYAVGIDSAVRLAFISKYVDLGADPKTQGKAQKLFERCEMMDPREPPPEDTPELDRIHEWFTEALLRHVGCTDISRPEQANDPIVDFHFTAGDHRFSAECKRIKIEGGLLSATKTAKGQIECDSFIEKGEAHRLIVLDCTPCIACKVVKEHGGLPAPHIETLIWKEFSMVKETLAKSPEKNPQRFRPAKSPKSDAPPQRRRRKTNIPNAYYNTMVFASVPCFVEKLIHQTNPQMMMMQEWTGGSEAAVGYLYNLILLNYKGCAETPEGLPIICVPDTILLVPDRDLIVVNRDDFKEGLPYYYDTNSGKWVAVSVRGDAPAGAMLIVRRSETFSVEILDLGKS